MAVGNNENENINTSKEKGRKTPRDLELTGSFVETTRKTEKKARPPTYLETHANNYAKKELANAFGTIQRWAPMFRSDLEEMNKGKIGTPYKFSDSMIWWLLCIMTVTDSDFRFISGFFSGLFPLFGLRSPSFSRLNERCSELIARMLDAVDGAPKERYGDHVLAIHVCANVIERIRRAGIDASGINMSNTNLWRVKKWQTSPKNRGWLVLHALCDVDTGEILAYAITDETVGDAPMLRVLVEAATEKGHVFDKLYADGAYSSDENWILLCRERKIGFVTSFKSNTRPTNNGSVARGEAARLWCSLTYDEWVKASGYGVRWKCECVFSDLKRLFPETITAMSNNGILRQLCSRIEVFNRYKITRAGIMGVTGNGVTVA
ncbi:MAG: transposase [Candidatus Methanomethylophilaceae archaeon]|nr:transposase [Candidatus Methanomethylophilaceae archaeon]